MDTTLAVGTGLKGYAHATYDTLVNVLGPAGEPCDRDKQHVEWVVGTPHGPATVYDYGDCHECRPRCERDPRLLPGDTLIEWHVGGHNRESFEWLLDLAGCCGEVKLTWPERDEAIDSEPPMHRPRRCPTCHDHLSRAIVDGRCTVCRLSRRGCS